MIKKECLFWLKDAHEVSYLVRSVEMCQTGIKCNMKTLLKCKFNVKNGECLRDQPSQRLMIKCPEKNPSEQSREPTTNLTHI